jgi:hypothetical protein
MFPLNLNKKGEFACISSKCMIGELDPGESPPPMRFGTGSWCFWYWFYMGLVLSLTQVPDLLSSL